MPLSERHKYIIVVKIRNKSREIQEWILGQPKIDRRMVEYDKGNGRQLLMGYSDDRAHKVPATGKRDVLSEKTYRCGPLTKGNINKRSYNKFLKMDRNVKMVSDYDKTRGRGEMGRAEGIPY